MFFGVLLFHPFFVIIHNAEVCARAAHAAADTDSRCSRVNTLEKTEQKSGGRGPAGIVKRIFGSFRDGSAEEFLSDMRWIFGYTKKIQMVCCYSDTVRRAQCITEPCFRNHQQVCN